MRAPHVRLRGSGSSAEATRTRPHHPAAPEFGSICSGQPEEKRLGSPSVLSPALGSEVGVEERTSGTDHGHEVRRVRASLDRLARPFGHVAFSAVEVDTRRR